MAKDDVSLEETLNSFGSSDLIPHQKLINIAFNAWHSMPVSERGGPQAVERWRRAIYSACKPSLDVAASVLKERNADEPGLLGTKLALLKEAFTKQVDRAMRDLSDRDRDKRNHAKAMASVNDMIKQMNKS